MSLRLVQNEHWQKLQEYKAAIQKDDQDKVRELEAWFKNFGSPQTVDPFKQTREDLQYEYEMHKYVVSARARKLAIISVMLLAICIAGIFAKQIEGLRHDIINFVIGLSFLFGALLGVMAIIATPLIQMKNDWLYKKELESKFGAEERGEP